MGDLPGEVCPTTLIGQSIAYLTEHVSPELCLIRLSMGTMTIEKTSAGLEWTQLVDYSIFGAPLSSCRSRADFITVLGEKGIDREVLDRHLRKNLQQTGFYRQTYAEIVHAITREIQGQHTLSFLHIYRFLERISYAFPLIFASRTKDFQKGYNNLKKFLGGSSDTGELAFFTNFIVNSLDAQILDGTSRISFASVSLPSRAKACGIVLEFMQGNAEVNVPGESIDLNNRAIVDLLITLRNRFFHFSPEHTSNISVLDVPDSDAFFKCFNALFINWLVVIYFEVLRHQVS